MPIERREIEKGLLGKGFVKGQGSHRFFRLKVDKKITGIKTWTSHGSGYKDYDDTLIDAIKKELRLDTKQQLLRLIDCSLTHEGYVAYLRGKGLTL